jgi:ribonuclease HII
MANRRYENSLMREGFPNVVGLDEAGRGPLAGPLVVAAVIFPKSYSNSEINDSKQLSYKKRRELEIEIKKHALYYHVEEVSLEDIDRYNIYQASKIGMIRCLDHLAGKYDAILTDAMPLENYTCPMISLIHGDALSLSIAAASILAKVHRDNIMLEFDKIYPQYDFKKNKGYGTKEHLQALEKYGVTPIHRKTYEPIATMLKPNLFNYNK